VRSAEEAGLQQIELATGYAAACGGLWTPLSSEQGALLQILNWLKVNTRLRLVCYLTL
jgi:hypothetical protein